VEHLRTVHFTLIATSVALIIVALTTKPYSTEVAKNQLHRILELKSGWSAEMVSQMKTTLLVPHWEGSSSAQTGIGPEVSNSNSKLKITPDGVYRGTYTDDARPAHAVNFLMKINSSESIVLSNARIGSFDSVVPKIPASLSGFQKWWDQLNDRNYQVFFPKALYPRGQMDLNKSHPLLFLDVDPFLNYFPLDRPLKPGPREFVVELTLDYQNEIRWLYPAFGSHDETFVPTYLGSFPSSKGSGLVLFPVGVSYYVQLDTETLADFMQVKRGDFNHSFYDLKQVGVKNGIDDLGNLENVLSKVEVSDTPAFEAFGIKFPADVATLGGTVALLAVQLYFVVYLKQLSGRLKADDLGWDVPWMGMDSSGLTKGIFFVTTALFPPISLIVLFAAATIRITRGYWDIEGRWIRFLASPWHWHWTVQCKLLLFVAAMILSACLGGLCWKYRPQLTPGTPTEEPEDQI